MGLSLGISFLRAILLGLGVIGLSGGVAKRSSLTGWKEGMSVRLTALVCLGLSLPTGEPVLGEAVEQNNKIHILLRGTPNHNPCFKHRCAYIYFKQYFII